MTTDIKLLLLILLACTALVLVLSSCAQAQAIPRDLSVGITYGSPPVANPKTYVHRASAPRKHTKKKKKAHIAKATPERTSPTKVMAYVQEIRPTCLKPVRVVGSQGLTDGQAEASAQKAWMEQIRYDFGEAMMDLDNAVGYEKRCTRSSIGEVAGQTFHRCEITASPCRPVMTQGASK